MGRSRHGFAAGRLLVGEVSHRVERWDHVDTLVELAWDLGPDQKLTLDRPLDEALGGTQFRPVEGGGTDPTPASVTP
jgi:hypothetical protein